MPGSRRKYLAGIRCIRVLASGNARETAGLRRHFAVAHIFRKAGNALVWPAICITVVSSRITSASQKRVAITYFHDDAAATSLRGLRSSKLLPTKHLRLASHLHSQDDNSYLILGALHDCLISEQDPLAYFPIEGLLAKLNCYCDP